MIQIPTNLGRLIGIVLGFWWQTTENEASMEWLPKAPYSDVAFVHVEPVP